jgi:putative ABC transport system permease protein
VGAVAAVVGLGLGILLAVGLLQLVNHLGLQVPQGDTVVLTRTVVAAIVVGLAVTVGSAIYPAMRASRIPPVAAINDYGPRPSAPLRRRTIVGLVLLLVGIGVLVFGLVRHYTQLTSRMQVVGIGALVVFVGVAVLSPVLTRPLSRVLGWPLLRLVGVTGTLSRGNAMRNPRRTAATASALTIGLSLVCLVAIFAASAKASLHDALDTGVRADYILSAKQFAGFSPIAAQRVNLGLVSGTTNLGANDILLSQDEAKGYHVATGGTLLVDFSRTGPQPFHVAGVYRNDHFTGGIPVKFLLQKATFETNFGGTQQDTLVYVQAAPGQRTEAKRQVERVLDDFPNVTVQTPAGFQHQQEQTINMFLSVLVALLLLSEVIAILGIVNTLALSVFERTREIGMLRAVGMTRRQLRRVIRYESTITAIIGGILGIVVGLVFGWIVAQGLSDQGLVFVVPYTQLVGFLIVATLFGILAAILPARRAAKLNVLEALQYE